MCQSPAPKEERKQGLQRYTPLNSLTLVSSSGTVLCCLGTAHSSGVFGSFKPSLLCIIKPCYCGISFHGSSGSVMYSPASTALSLKAFLFQVAFNESGLEYSTFFDYLFSQNIGRSTACAFTVSLFFILLLDILFTRLFYCCIYYIIFVISFILLKMLC